MHIAAFGSLQKGHFVHFFTGRLTFLSCLPKRVALRQCSNNDDVLAAKVSKTSIKIHERETAYLLVSTSPLQPRRY